MKKIIVIILLLCTTTIMYTQEKDAAMEAQNPLASIISMPLQNNTKFGLPEDGTSNTLNIQPVYPVTFSNKAVLINRAIIQIKSSPDYSETSGNTNGIGDINYTAWYSPPPKSSFTWGVGFVSIWPTATDDILGTGKFSIGPSVVLVNMTKKLMLAAIISNWFSVAGKSDRADVNTFYFQYIMTYFLANKWYLVSAPINTAKWEAEDGEKWTIPLGGGFGKMFNIGTLPVDLQTQAFYYAVKPAGGPEWELRVQFKMIFPK